MIDGLRLTMSGAELRTLLEQGIGRHDALATRWMHETQRNTGDETEGAPLLPLHICENEAERHAWCASTLTFIRDHVDPGETYRLGADDLAFGELLPQKPKWVEQDEYEERTRVGFGLERLVKSIDSFGSRTAAFASRTESSRVDFHSVGHGVVRGTTDPRTTRGVVEDPATSVSAQNR
jgi:hypothetical protein